MFKLPFRIPSTRDSAQDWADYAEYLAWKKNGVILPMSELLSAPGLIADEIDIDGAMDETDEFILKSDEIASEIGYRKMLCGDRYPFRLVNQDYGIQFEPPADHGGQIYLYLLLCTRLSMKNNRVHAGLDGSLLFEKLSAEVARFFFGANAEVDIIGTSRQDKLSFRAKLAELTRKIGEGGDIHAREGHRPQDSGVDIMVWKGFTDRLPSKMIAFGQCKTGTSWETELKELNTEIFCKLWFKSQPVLTPVRLFFCAQYFPRHLWEVRVIEAGLVFERFRIIDYLPSQIDTDLLGQINAWTSAAVASLKGLN